ncbi:MAG: aldo/keto reductase, partial [Coprobacillus sp.]
LSNPTQEFILEAEKYAKIEAVQLPYSMVNREQEDLLKWCHKRGYLTMSYGSLGAGILSGTFRELPQFDEKDIRYTFYPFFKEPMFSQIQLLLMDMDVIAKRHRVPVSHVALNWVTQKEFISSSLVGVANKEQALENSAAFSFSLSNEEMCFLDDSIDKHLK